MSIATFIDKLVPEQARENEYQNTLAQNVVGVSYFMVIAGMFFSGMYWLFNHPTGAAIIAAGFMVALVAPLAMRWTGSSRLGTFLTTFAMWALLCGLSYTTGGVLAPSTMWFATVPLIATIMGGTRTGVIWGVISVLTVVGLFMAERLGVVFPLLYTETPTAEQITMFQMIINAGVVFFVAAFTVYSELSKQNAFFTANQTRIKVEQNAAALQQAAATLEQEKLSRDTLIQQAMDISNKLDQASGLLTTTAEQARQATQQVAHTIQQIAHGTAQQAAELTNAGSIVGQVARAIESVAQGAQEQASATAQSVDITTKITTTIKGVVTNAQAGATGSAKAAQTAQVGADTIQKTIKGMENIKAKVDLSAQKVKEMGQHSNQIGTIVETINDIASQTNLLALNAAIEAARAGEHGKGFAVVADEVRKLAEKSATATREIAGLIKGIQQITAESVLAMEEGATEVKLGVERADQASQALSGILQAVESVREKTEQAAAGVQQIQTLSAGLVTAVEAVSAVVEENTAATEQMAAGASGVTIAIDNVVHVNQEHGASVQAVTAAAEEMSAQVDEVTAAAQQLSKMAKTLQERMTQFNM